ncbi:SxtJ family membrane protein [Mucilaginibacter sabulilitoris]|uniref:SxtJ family membrane protein n=1 Tax=Mucilaginibacter sabulilitoris TaxID=1173583 RepID=A0ABZ0TGB6_9SPHI|nr:SxtJ family membrane protein [Mucilaginibacter sabulilitoris]WPU92222.1 SxtJ family membrane protein [Mucilaginibacter sabulilitoris]
MKKYSPNKKFGLILGIGCVAFSIYLTISKHNHLLLLDVIGLTLLLAAWLFPDLLNPIRIFWDKVGKILGYLNSIIILSIVFFILLTPIGLLISLLKKKGIETKWQKESLSYWQASEQPEKDSFRRQF